jgi:hypothetical protein
MAGEEASETDEDEKGAEKEGEFGHGRMLKAELRILNAELKMQN